MRVLYCTRMFEGLAGLWVYCTVEVWLNGEYLVLYTGVLKATHTRRRCSARLPRYRHRQALTTVTELRLSSQSAQCNHGKFPYFYRLDIGFKHVYDMAGTQQTLVECCQSIRYAYLVCRALSAQCNHIGPTATMFALGRSRR